MKHRPFGRITRIVVVFCVVLLAVGGCLDFAGFDTEAAAPDASTNGSRQVDVSRYRFGPPRERAAHVPAAVARAVKEDAGALADLVGYLVDGVTDPLERARIIHDWVALNISYDAAAFLSGSIGSQDPGAVLEKGKAVCQGYSELFARMCRRAEIPCRLISGFGKGYGSDPFTPMDFGRTNHAWNAIEAAGAWYLVDVTWDSGYLDGRAFVRDYGTGYFLLEPGRFVYDHLPAAEAWQLAAAPISAARFNELPRLKSRYFDIFSREPGYTSVTKVGTEAVLTLGPPRTGWDLTAELYHNDPDNRWCGAGQRAGDGRAMVQVEDGSVTVRARFPNPGAYVLNLYASPHSDSAEREYDFVGAFGLNASGASAATYPRLYSNWKPEYCLFEPLLSPLVVGTPYRFRLTLPGERSLVMATPTSWKVITAQTAGLFDFLYTLARPEQLSIALPDRGAEGHYAFVMTWQTAESPRK